MKQKRIFSLLLAAVLAFSLVGCGAASSAPARDLDYGQILHEARAAEDNEYYLILTNDKSGEGTYAAIDGYADELTADDLTGTADMSFPMLNITPEDVTNYAITLSMMNIRVYGIAIVMPAEGRSEAVQEGFQAYIDSQKMSMEHYLADQYAIAQQARVEVAESGEVILVCCENADTVMDNILTALKG